MTKLKIVILGAGALGSLLGVYLAEEHDVILYCKEKKAKTIIEKGLKVSGINGTLELKINASNNLSNQHFDLGIISVKSYDNETILKDIIEQKINFNLIASIQNGLKDDFLIENFGIEKILGCVVNEAAKKISDHEVSYVNSGACYFGTLTKDENSNIKKSTAKSLVKTVNNYFNANISQEMKKLTWYKNLTTTTITAIYCARNITAKELYLNPYNVELFLKIVEETKQIAIAENVKLEKHPLLKDIFLVETTEEKKKIIESKKRKYENIKKSLYVQSTLQDLRSGKNITEIDSILGTMIQKAKKCRIP